VVKPSTKSQLCCVRYIDSLKCFSNKSRSFLSSYFLVWCIRSHISAKLVRRRILLEACVSMWCFMFKHVGKPLDHGSWVRRPENLAALLSFFLSCPSVVCSDVYPPRRGE
jgi:hypothetical protein